MIQVNVLQTNISRSKTSDMNRPCIRVHMLDSGHQPILCHEVVIEGGCSVIQSGEPNAISVNLKVPDGVVVKTITYDSASGQPTVKKVCSPGWDTL